MSATPKYKELRNSQKLELYESLGPCCNACKDWYTDNNEEPCASCTGGITDTGDYSNFEMHGALRPNDKIQGAEHSEAPAGMTGSAADNTKNGD